jgi:hypothetical protein
MPWCQRADLGEGRGEGRELGAAEYGTPRRLPLLILRGPHPTLSQGNALRLWCAGLLGEECAQGAQKRSGCAL